MHPYNLFPACVKLIAYLASVVIVVSSKPCVRPSPRAKICLSLLSTCTDEFISAPKITMFLPQLPSGYENYERSSNPIP